MARGEKIPVKTKTVEELQDELNKVHILLDSLLKRLAKTEPVLKEILKDSDKDDEIYLVPSGTFYGVKYE